jgi:hypothetical protein
MHRASSALGFRTGVRSVIFAWLDLLRMESSGSKARRGAAWVWPKEGWPAQHGARERREVSFLICARGPRGHPGSKKKYPKNCHGPKTVEVHPKGHPRGRWGSFESLAAAQKGQKKNSDFFIAFELSIVLCSPCGRIYARCRGELVCIPPLGCASLQRQGASGGAFPSTTRGDYVALPAQFSSRNQNTGTTPGQLITAYWEARAMPTPDSLGGRVRIPRLPGAKNRPSLWACAIEGRPRPGGCRRGEEAPGRGGGRQKWIRPRGGVW